ncbi:DNA-binding domain-containing protein [Clostridium sp. JN-9]|uniref:DNA-binding domain-containing protein n=1 Tax=Clostridium sp. JN-9 TaxID=2507159 RepID=UPI000FFE023F|nr:DNA-binding domain-containing protein [Clostridium sp. JN-9]QAT39346.1 response regulator [Clostridium sp. JN-9]
MRFYILDDDINIVKILTMIIEGEDDSYDVVGSSCDAESALDEILLIKPDIVLVDLLMPVIDGNTLVKKIKDIKPDICFIMISQVQDTKLRSDSYEAGIEFFINKPINKIEVKNVISKVAEKIEMKNMLSDIKKMLNTSDKNDDDKNRDVIKIKHVLGMLGMLGEKGTNDIIKICSYMIDNNKSIDECNLNELESYLGDNPQIVKQRIRRAIKNGLTNIANLGIEDYANDTFNIYANVLFDFSSVKAEMDYINGKKKVGGKVSINKFIEGLIFTCQDN